MRFITYKKGSLLCPALICRNDTVYDLDGFGIKDMNELIEKYDELKEKLISASQKETVTFLRNVTLASPIPVPKQDIICLGINYAAHAEESARYKKETYERNRNFPVYFSKRVNEALPDGGTLEINKELDDKIDYEAELAVIIKKDAKNVKPENAADYVFGYTILNDISARTLQSDYKQWYFGKSLDSFTPMGPWIVTADEFDFEPELKIQSYVNGEIRQDSNTGLLIFGLKRIISELSSGFMLKSGTIISTGTPAGAGMGFDPPKFLKTGDRVECKIEKIGTLTTYIK